MLIPGIPLPEKSQTKCSLTIFVKGRAGRVFHLFRLFHLREWHSWKSRNSGNSCDRFRWTLDFYSEIE